ncbi:MAG: YARHG domain-containing protein [Salinivirgaceae bacterium]
MRYLFNILIIISFSGFSQNQNLLGKWTNGIDIYWCSQYSDSILFFSGGNLHEGGASFALQIIDNDNYKNIGKHPENKYPPNFGQENQLVVLKEIIDTKVLIIQEKNEILGLLMKIPEYETLTNIVYRNKINFELAGKYFDSISQNEIIFESDIQIVKGIEKDGNYKFEKDYDYPIEVITFESGKSYWYEKTKTGLKLYNAKKNNYDNWYKGEILNNLIRVSKSDIVDYKSLKGKYQFASEIIMTDDILYYFDKRELKIIRNEIFARHGYRFKTTEMKAYFENQNWYVGANVNVDSLLTDLELINIGQIIRFEKRFD